MDSSYDPLIELGTNSFFSSCLIIAYPHPILIWNVNDHVFLVNFVYQPLDIFILCFHQLANYLYEFCLKQCSTNCNDKSYWCLKTRKTCTKNHKINIKIDCHGQLLY